MAIGKMMADRWNSWEPKKYRHTHFQKANHFLSSFGLQKKLSDSQRGNSEQRVFFFNQGTTRPWDWRLKPLGWAPANVMVRF